MFTLEQLEQLCVLDKYQTFTAAASALHISQPSLSRAMQNLENELGVSLFDRSRNRASLNANGKAAVEMAGQILDACQQMKLDLQKMDLASRSASLGSCAPLPLEFLEQFIHEKFPSWKVKRAMDTEENLQAGLDTEIYDAVVLEHPLTASRFFCRPIMQESLYIVLHQSHPLYGKEAIDLREMNGQTMLLVQNIGTWQDLVDQKMPDAAFLIQQDWQSLQILQQESTLPYFVTDPLGGLTGPDRRQIRILDPQATKTFYLCAREEGRSRLDFLFSRPDLFFNLKSSKSSLSKEGK